MPWQVGTRLDRYLASYKPDFDYTLLSAFRRMIQSLQAEGIAHGGLEP
jgi:hypothetical protein